MKKNYLFILLFSLCLFAKPCFSKLAFINSNFEEGDFRNWEVKGWSVVEPIYFPQENLPFEEKFGFFSAESNPWGRNIIDFYTGKNIAPEKRILISKKFLIDKPILSFTMEGSLDKGKNVVGIDLNLDGVCDVNLEEKDIKDLIRKGVKRFFIDVSKYIGKEASFFVSVSSNPKYPRYMKLKIDDIELEDYVPSYFEVERIKQSGENGEIRLNLINPYKKEGKIDLEIIVYDFLSKKILEKEIKEIIPAEKTITRRVNFKLNFSPHYRIHITSFSESGSISQYFAKRWFLSEKKEGRRFILINEGWEVTKSDNIKLELPEENAVWEKESPVKPSGSFKYRALSWREKKAQVWYRKEIEIPEWFENKNIALFLNGGGGGILTVFANGKEIATKNIYKYNNYRFILKNFRKGKNEIILRFRNPDYYIEKRGKRYKEPVWYYYGPSIGIFGNIYLENLPSIFVSKVLIDPSYRKKELYLRIFVKNAGEKSEKISLEEEVLNKEGKKALEINNFDENLLPGEEKIIKISQHWENPILWSPDNPELLLLRIFLNSEEGKDIYEERFGFREFWIENNRILMNGYPVRILDLTGLESEKLYLAKKWYGANAERAPWISYYAPMVHDEIGFLLRGLFEHIWSPKELKNEEEKENYWKKLIEYERKSMEYLYNNPSCWSWVIGNERGGQGYFRIPYFKEKYIKLAKFLSSIDPVRPVSCDGDLDLFGTTPIWNVHYPHEYGLAYGLPNKAYFFKKGVKLMDWFPHPPYDGKKPIFLGEAFSGGNVSPDWLSPLGGEKAYTPRGLLDTWKDFFMIRQRAYRDQGIVGYEPFEPFSYVKNFYPVDVYVKNYNHLFYGGRKIKREIIVFNDTFSFKNFVLNWSFGDYKKGKIKLKMYPGEKKILPVYINLPEVKKRENIKFSIYLEENGKTVGKRWGKWEGIYSIFPEITINEKIAVIPYDKDICNLLKFFKIKPVNEIKEAKILITNGEFLKEREKKEKFLENGGIILVLDQKKDVEGYPLLVEHPDTHSHILSPSHPLLKEINGKDDFSFWGNENWICKRFYLKPTEKFGRVLVEGGDRQGLRFTNLIEIPERNGSVIFCSLLFKENFKENPVVGYFFRNLVKYAESKNKKENKKVGTLLSDNAYKILKNAGFIFDDLASIENPNIEKYEVLWIDAEISNVDISAMYNFVKDGGTLILNRITPELLTVYKNLLPSDFKLIPAKKDIIYGGEVLKIKSSPLLEGISNYDLWWKRGTFERGGPKVRVTAEVSDFYISGKNIEILTNPPVLGIFKNKKGKVIIDQIKWDEALAKEGKSIRSFINFAYNIGIPIQKKEKTEKKGQFKKINLPVNFEVKKGIFDGLKKDISEKIKGNISIKNIPFYLNDTKGILLGTNKNFSSYPRSIKIKVKSRASEIYFLHTSAFGYIDYDKGKEVIEYILHCKKGNENLKIKIPVRYAEEIFEYLSEDPGSLINTQQATSFEKDGISLYLFTWKNPTPDMEIEEIEIVSKDKEIIPIIFGITLKTPYWIEKKEIKRRKEGMWSIKSRKEREKEGRIWAIIGPFPNNPPPKGGYDYVFPPEKEIDFKKTYKGYGKNVKWEKYVQPKELFNKRIGIDQLELFEIKEGLDPQNYVCYFYSKVYSEKEKEAIVTCGFDDAGKVFLNGECVIAEFKHKYPAIPGDYIKVVKLKKGWNEILIKVVNNFLKCMFYFDIKEKDDKAIREWEKGNKNAIASLPSLKLKFDAFAETKRDINVSGLFYIEANGKKYFSDLKSNNSNSFTYFVENRILKINFENKGREALIGIIPYEIGRGTFKKGSFGIKFLIPEGGSSSYILLAGRNAGGRNIGDVSIELLGGYPAEKYGGRKDKKSVPYQKMRIRYDRKEKSELYEIPVKNILKEGIWNDFVIKWGGNEGIKIILNGKTIFQKKEDKLPLFDSHKRIHLILPSDTRNKNQGEIYIKDIFLVDN